MNKNKYKSGSEKRKIKDKIPLEKAGKNPKQQKLNFCVNENYQSSGAGPSEPHELNENKPTDSSQFIKGIHTRIFVF